MSDPKQKQDAFNVLLHSADVSNATRKLPVALYWSRLKREVLVVWTWFLEGGTGEVLSSTFQEDLCCLEPNGEPVRLKGGDVEVILSH